MTQLITVICYSLTAPDVS